jgi:outer membrane receptor protein involved in Fe transport
MDFDYNPSTFHNIKFGVEYLHHDFCPEVNRSRILEKENGTTKQDTIYKTPGHDIGAHEATIYAEDNWKITDRLRTDIGLGASAFFVQKRSYYSMQPRISLRYQLTNDVALKTAFTQMTQYVHLLTSMPIAMPTDLWVPVTKRLKPMKAYQYTAGGYYTGLKNWEISVEAYYKSMRHVLEYKDGVSFLGFSSDWDNLVEMGKGRSYGIEFMAQKKVGNDTGWITYTLSKSDRKFSEGGINAGERFPYTYDRRHTINVVYNHKFNRHFDLDATWMFYSGGATTLALKKSTVLEPDSYNTPQETEYVPHRNNYRLPCTHTLSLGLNFRKQLKHGIMRTWNISIYNAYNAMNPTILYRNDDDNYLHPDTRIHITKYTLLPFIPSATYSLTF